MIVVVCAFEDVTQTFQREPNLGGFTPTEKIKSNLTQPIILSHAVHCVSIGQGPLQVTFRAAWACLMLASGASSLDFEFVL